MEEVVFDQVQGITQTDIATHLDRIRAAKLQRFVPQGQDGLRSVEPELPRLVRLERIIRLAGCFGHIQ